MNVEIIGESGMNCHECKQLRDSGDMFVCVTCDYAFVCATCFMRYHKLHEYEELDDFVPRKRAEMSERLKKANDQCEKVQHMIKCLEPLKQLNFQFRTFMDSEGSNRNPGGALSNEVRQLLSSVLEVDNPTPATYFAMEFEVAEIVRKMRESRAETDRMVKLFENMINQTGVQLGGIEQLSDELLTKIIMHLKTMDRCKCGYVSNRWRILMKTNQSFWSDYSHLRDMDFHKMLNLQFSAKEQLQTVKAVLIAAAFCNSHVQSVSIHLWDLELVKMSVLGNLFKSCPNLNDPLRNFGHKLKVLLLNIRGMDLMLTKEKGEIRQMFGESLQCCSNLEHFYASGVNPITGLQFESWLPIAKNLTKLGLFVVTREHWEIESLNYCVHLRTLGLCLGAWQINCVLDGWVNKVFDNCKSLTKFAVLYPRRYERVQSDDLAQVFARGSNIKQFLFIFAPFTTKEFWRVFRERPLNAPKISIILYDAPFLDVASLAGISGLDIENYSCCKQSNWRHTIKNFFLND